MRRGPSERSGLEAPGRRRAGCLQTKRDRSKKKHLGARLVDPIRRHPQDYSQSNSGPSALPRRAAGAHEPVRRESAAAMRSWRAVHMKKTPFVCLFNGVSILFQVGRQVGSPLRHFFVACPRNLPQQTQGQGPGRFIEPGVRTATAAGPSRAGALGSAASCTRPELRSNREVRHFSGRH